MSQPSTIDLLTPFDPTAYTQIDGGQLEQLVAGATPFTDKGFNVITSDTGVTPNVPNANTTIKWQNYIWIRITATAVIPYVWSPYVNDATFLGWVSLAASAIGIGTITGANIALNTIQDSNIISLSYSKLSGAPVGLPPSGAAGGVLTGTYPNPSIGNGQITGAMIAAATIAGSNIAAGTILGSNIGASTIATGNIGPLAINFTTQIAPGTALQVLRTNAGATNIEGVNPLGSSAFGRLLQIVENTTGAVVTNSGHLANTTSIPNANSTGITDSGLNLAITPISSTSTLYIEVIVPIYMNNVSTSSFVGLFTANAGAVAAVAGVGFTNGGNGISSTVKFTHSVASGSMVLRTYYILFGIGSSATAYINSIDGSNNTFGLSKAVIRIVEIL